MLLKVNPHKIEIVKSPVNEREINISKCTFEFADEITNDYVKEAYFTFGGTTYKQIIVNDECDFPSEVLTKKGTVEIGVVAYLVENETEIKRYNPSPAYFDTWVGSLKDNAENSEPITPTDKEQIEQAITNLQNDVTDLEESKQDTLVSGENIKTINGESVLGSGNIEIDLSNYYNKQEIDQSQASQNANISKNTNDIVTLNNNLTNYSLITETGSQIVLNVNPSNYQITAILKDKNGNTIYTSNVIDLPIESMIVNATYDSTTKEIVFTLQNGTTLRVSVADLVSGLVSTDELNTILANYYTKTEIDNLLSGKVDTTTYTQGQATQDANIEENASNIDWLQTLVNQMPTVSGQGTDLSLESVLNYRLMKFLPQGTSSQDGEPTPTTPVPVKSVTGDNSLIISNENLIDFQNNSLIQRTININGVVETNSNCACSNNLTPVLTNSPYTLSSQVSMVLRICEYDKNKVFIKRTQKEGTIYSIITSENTKYIGYSIYLGGSNMTQEKLNSYKLMFTKGSTAPTTYVEHEEQNYLITLKSNNLIGLDTAQYPVDLKVGDKITLTNNNNVALQLNLYTNFGDSERNDYWTVQPGRSRTITVAEDSKAIAWNRLFSGLAWVNKGETSLSYKPYIANPIELNSSPGGTIRDQIIGKPNNWFKREYIGKVVLDGSESGWLLAGTDTNTFRFVNNSVIADALTRGNSSNYLMCNEFQKYNGNAGISAIDSEGIAIRDTRNGFSIRILKTRVSDLSTFLTWLSEHNAIVYYVLENYEDISITDTTLINQLNDIYNNAHSYNGVTNITTTYEDGNEQMYLDIEALKNVWDTSL